MLLLIVGNAFSYDSTKLHIRLKIMNPAMWPSSPNSITISGDTAFQGWLSRHKVTKLEKVFSNEYDNVGELKYKYKMFHDSNAFVLEAALDSMAGIKDVFIYDIVPMGMDVPMCSTMYHPNDNFIDALGSSNWKSRIDPPNPNPRDWSWHLNKIEAECAWDVTKGDTNVLIGIVDSYMDTFHYDMRGKFKIWKHWNFGANDTLNLPEFNITGDIKNWPLNWYTKDTKRTFYHGMMCAGAAASSFNNSTGISGIGGNCKLAGYSFLGFGKTNPDTSISGWTDLDEAVMIAIEDNVKVINCSWGPAIGPVSSKNRAGFLLGDEVVEGIKRGVVFTMAGGNPDPNNYRYNLPSNQFILLEGAIVVAASDTVDKIGKNFNHDTYIDVCAPYDFVTTKIQFNPNFPGQITTGSPPINRQQDEGLTGFGGTSSSSALVAGIVGLMFSANPYLSPAGIECLLKAGCDPMNYSAIEDYSLDSSNISITIPSNHLGAGRVNAYNAVFLAKGESGSKYGSHTWNELRHVASDVTLESGCTLTITHNILISPNRKIIVKPGAKLIVDGAILTNLCGDGPWGGIVVLGDSSKIQTPAYQGVVELKNGSIIENAINGVRAIGWYSNGTINPKTTKGIIKAENTTFRNNTTDVVIWGKTTSILHEPKANISYFKKCNFYTTNDNKIANLGEHVNLTWCNNINMQGCKFEDQRTGVSPKVNGRLGINAKEASFNLTNFTSGITVTTTKFIKLKQAVQSISLPGGSRTSIDGCSTTCYKGFYMLKNTNARVINNQFTIKDDLFEYNSTTYPYGLYMDATTAFDVEHNMYTGTKTSSWITGGHGGLVVRDAGANATEFYRSVFEDLTVASEVLNENKDAGNDKIGLTFRCNDYTDDMKDLQVLKEPDIDFTSLTGMANNQGSLTLPADNLFGNSSPVLYLNIDNEANKMTYFHQDENNSSVNTRTKPSLVNNISLINTNQTGALCPDKLTKSGTGWPTTKRSDLSVYKSAMSSVNTSWKAVIDNGNSPTNVVNDIETATTGNATFVYNQLIGYSPWLSMDALATLAAKEGAFSDLQIRNVLKANPQAGRSGWIKSILLNRSTAMSPFYIADIVANADSLTDRDTLAWQVAEANTNYDLLLNDLVGWYLDDTLNHLATLDTLLTHPTNPMYRYQLAGLYFEQGLYTDYQNVLDSIPAQIDLTDQEADYHTTYNNLYNQIKAWKLDSMPLPLLDSSQLIWLQNFYESNPKM
ncbi:MAG: S8 family serine peptidase, partial [Bacteroidia bacterium]|nr:S8 family serine peptidase [Bacteroidia bacterium]